MEEVVGVGGWCGRGLPEFALFRWAFSSMSPVFFAEEGILRYARAISQIPIEL